MKTQTKTQTIGGYLIEKLQMNGVDHIFGIPGDYILAFDKMVEESPIQFVNATRENTAGAMADAYARIRGIGACCITYGVGINIANAMAQCNLENSPVVFISGAAGKEEKAKCPYLHHLLSATEKEETTQFEIFQKLTCAQCVLNDPKKAQSEIDRVLRACLHEKRPVYIELPRDLVLKELTVEESVVPPHFTSDPNALGEALYELGEMLKSAKRPVIWAGHEIERFDLAGNLLEFARKYNIPIATSLLGKGVISERDPLCLGVYQGKLSADEIRGYVESADLVILLGVMLDDVTTGILSTHIDTIDQVAASKNRVAIKKHTYAISLVEWMQGLCDLDLNLYFKNQYPAFGEREQSFHPKKNEKITSTRLFACLNSYLKPGTILASDIGDCLFGAAECIVEQDCFLTNAFFSSIGWGTPAAIGASLASSHRTCAVVGDGAFQMSGMELSTCIRYGLDPIIILLNNHGYATERPLIEGDFNDLTGWNYWKLPEVLGGGIGVKVNTEQEFDQALQSAFSKRGTYWLIEVDLDKLDATEGLKRFCALVKNKKS
jgi:indolepyruvate decarboxylase